MLSQPHYFKGRQLSCSSLKVPSKFQVLTCLVDLVRLCVGEADGCDCGDASSNVSSAELLSLGWEGAQTFSRTGSADASVEQVSSEDESILILPTDAKHAELEMTELEELEKLFATPTTKEHVLMDVEPRKQQVPIAPHCKAGRCPMPSWRAWLPKLRPLPTRSTLLRNRRQRKSNHRF